MKRNIRILILILMLSVFPVLRGEEIVDADALITRVLERIAYLESLYEQGIDVEFENETTVQDDTSLPIVERSVYQGLYEMWHTEYITEYQGIKETLTVRNPEYSFALAKNRGISEYAVTELFNDRDGIISGQVSDTTFDGTPGNLVGVFIMLLRLRDLFESDTFKVESVEKYEDQYRLVFRSNVMMDEIDRVLGGELFFNADDYSLEEWEIEREIFIPDVLKKQCTNHTKYTYSEWEGIKYPKLIEDDYSDNEKTLHTQTTIRSFRLGPPNKKEFYLKYYGIPEPASPRNPPSPAIFVVTGLILIAAGIYLKRRASAGSALPKQ
ncbi:MAG: hypothetical protein IKE64_01105 [Thermoguttaceae bacterium]|nr:hypothetical protein [Thermoguttaceae bacterium]